MIVENEYGTWKVTTNEFDIETWVDISLKQKYIDEVLTPAHQQDQIFKQKKGYIKERQLRITRLGDARAKDPDRIATEDGVIDQTTSIIQTEELDQIAPMLEWFGDKTLSQIENYIINNVTNLSEARAFLIILTKAVWGTLNLTRILANRELPPEE